MRKGKGGAYRSGVAAVHDAEVHDDAAIDLPVREDALPRCFVQSVHSRHAAVLLQSDPQHALLLVAQECRLFGPVRDEPLACDANDDGEESFEDEDPPPAAVAPYPVHIRDRIRQQP